MSTRTEGIPQSQLDQAVKVNGIAAGLGTARQTTLLALCDTLDTRIAASLALADAPLLAAALALRTSCGLEAATFANVGLDLTNPRLT